MKHVQETLFADFVFSFLKTDLFCIVYTVAIYVKVWFVLSVPLRLTNAFRRYRARLSYMGTWASEHGRFIGESRTCVLFYCRYVFDVARKLCVVTPYTSCYCSDIGTYGRMICHTMFVCQKIPGETFLAADVYLMNILLLNNVPFDEWCRYAKKIIFTNYAFL